MDDMSKPKDQEDDLDSSSSDNRPDNEVATEEDHDIKNLPDTTIVDQEEQESSLGVNKLHRRMIKNLRGFSKKSPKSSEPSPQKPKSSGWPFKLCSRAESAMSLNVIPDKNSTFYAESSDSPVCTSYKRRDDNQSGEGLAMASGGSDFTEEEDEGTFSLKRRDSIHELLPFLAINSSQSPNKKTSGSSLPLDQYPYPGYHHDLDFQVLDPGSRSVSTTATTAVLQNSPAGSRSPNNAFNSNQVRISELAIALRNQLSLTVSPYPYLARLGDSSPVASNGSSPLPPTSSAVPQLTAIQVREQQQQSIINRLCQLRLGQTPDGTFTLSDVTSHLFPNSQPIHTQIDYVHRLVPDLFEIINCSFYWGKMDRYEAEKLLMNKPEGTFLLRDSAQEEHLFSVSFRRFDRSLHARIEQYNHRFSFDSHDPGVYSAATVCGLIEHYKVPAHVMFFEPMLTIPLNRNFVFSLQDLTRATLCSRLTYDSVNQLPLPRKLKSFLKEYHYRQQIRIRRLD